MTLGALRVWNYAKTPTRGVRRLQVRVDDRFVMGRSENRSNITFSIEFFFHVPTVIICSYLLYWVNSIVYDGMLKPAKAAGASVHAPFMTGCDDLHSVSVTESIR